MKTVRVDLSRGTEEAVLYLQAGAPIYAACGDVTGDAAVYRVIAWEDEGEFTVSEDARPPGRNVEASMESLLMEGVRLLDEAGATR